MYNDSFKSRYTTIPLAHYSGCYGEGDVGLVENKISHNHKETEIIIVRDGYVQVCINNKITFTAGEGDIIVIPPYQYHCYSKPKGKSFSHHCICFDLGLLYDAEMVRRIEEGKLSVSCHITSELAYADKLFELVSECVECSRERSDGWELLAIGALSSFFGILKKNGHLKGNEPEEESGSDLFCKNVIDILNKEYKSEISTSLLSKRLSVTGAYFCRKFKARFGYTFSEYLCMYRVERSKELLRGSDIPISDIATEIGFSSFSYYSKVFKRYVGKAPKEYRGSHARTR